MTWLDDILQAVRRWSRGWGGPNPSDDRSFYPGDLNALPRQVHIRPDGGQSLWDAWNEARSYAQADSPQGTVIWLAPGVYGGRAPDNPLLYLEPDPDRPLRFSRTAPIVIAAQNEWQPSRDGHPSVTIHAQLTFYRFQYVCLQDIELIGPLGTVTYHDDGSIDDDGTKRYGDEVLQVDHCQQVLIRRCVINAHPVGAPGGQPPYSRYRNAIKANQCQFLYIEHCRLEGTGDEIGSCVGVDLGAVQGGHFRMNLLRDNLAQGLWTKFGSAYLTVEGNAFDGGQLGFYAGQGSDANLMVVPFVHYESYGIRFFNNVLSSVSHSAIGIQGAYATLIAFNTLYNCGDQSGEGIVEFTYGQRTGGTSPDAAQGWSNIHPDGQTPIPCRQTLFYNNILYNDSAHRAPSLFAIPDRYADTSPENSPAPWFALGSNSRVDEDVRIEGNLVWNAGNLLPLGNLGAPGTPSDPGPGLVEPGTGSDDTHHDNHSRRVDFSNNALDSTVPEPQLVDPTGGNLRPVASGNVFTYHAVTVPAFSWSAPTGVDAAHFALPPAT